MNLQRLNHPGAGLTTAVVLLCGVVSGAAMAAGNRHAIDVPPPAQVAAVETPSIPGIPGIQTPRTKSIPGVPQPQGVHSLSTHAEVPVKQVTKTEALDDALVLRPETPYVSKNAKAIQ